MESRILRVDGEADPHMWEQYSMHGLICETYSVYRLEGEKYLRARNRNPSFLAADVAIEETCPCQLRSCSKVMPTRSNESLFSRMFPFIRDSDHDWVLDDLNCT